MIFGSFAAENPHMSHKPVATMPACSSEKPPYDGSESYQILTKFYKRRCP